VRENVMISVANVVSKRKENDHTVLGFACDW